MKKGVLSLLLSFVCIQCFSFQADTLDSKTLPESRPFRHGISYQKASRYVVPLALVGYGFTSLNKGIAWRTDRELNHELLEEIPGFSTHLDDKLQYAPVAMAYTLSALGVKSKNNLFDRTALYLISNSLMGYSVNFLKTNTAKLRPSGEDRRSFPSGHTATAFVAAEFMRQEFSDASPIYGYLAYSMAGATGALRMMNNKHWFSDVLAGAGVGIATTRLTYLAYPWIKKKVIKKDMNIMAVPMIQKGKTGFSAIAFL
ncbi:MAG: phosphatase PAP2 family protein [Bacteroidota bacterium]